MDTSKFFDVFAGVVLVAVIAVVVYILRKEEKERGEKKFDERQLILRAEGNKKGFHATIIAGALAILLLEMGVVPPASATLALYVALMIGLVTFAVFCIRKDVFFHIGENGTYYLGLCAVIVLTDGVVTVVQIVDGSILQDGVPTFSSCNALVMAAAFLAIFLALLVRKPAREEDDE